MPNKPRRDRVIAIYLDPHEGDDLRRMPVFVLENGRAFKGGKEMIVTFSPDETEKG